MFAIEFIEEIWPNLTLYLSNKCSWRLLAHWLTKRVVLQWTVLVIGVTHLTYDITDLFFCSNVNPSIQMLMNPDTGHSTETTPPISGSPDVDELTKNPPPTTKSTPKKRSLCSSNKGITHLLDGMHSYHALFPFHALFPYNFFIFQLHP